MKEDFHFYRWQTGQFRLSLLLRITGKTSRLLERMEQLQELPNQTSGEARNPKVQPLASRGTDQFQKHL